jgi:Pyruvate/2-oxoacid:ferredoxin oxidoreductase delta subunit
MIARRFILHFPAAVADRPVVSRLAREFGLDFNILRATIDPGNYGIMLLELTGERDPLSRGLAFLTDAGVSVSQLDRQIRRDQNRCVDCGACLGFCPARCFAAEAASGRIAFDNGRCTACGQCLTACPRRAMEVSL